MSSSPVACAAMQRSSTWVLRLANGDSVTVRLPTGTTFAGALPREAVQLLAPGDRVQVEIWQGRVTMLNGRDTWSSPNWAVTISQLVYFWAAVLAIVLAPLAIYWGI